MNINIDIKQIDIKRYKDKVFDVVVILVALWLAVQIRSSQTKNIKSLREQKNEIIKHNEILTAIDRSAKTITAQRKLFSKETASTLIKTINALAKGSDVKIISMKPEQEQNYSDYLMRYPVNLEINIANYHALGRFISKLENYADTFIMLESIKIKLPEVFFGEGIKAYNLQANLRLSYFSIRD